MTRLDEIRFSPLVWNLFDLYLGIITSFRFHEVILSGAFDVSKLQGPIILISNHSTWWDGFFMRRVQKRLFPGRPLYTVTLGSEQDKLPFFFRRLGVLPLFPGPGETLGLLRNLVSRSKEAHGEIVVSFFPQGKIYPSAKRPLKFKRGIEVLVRALGATVIPIGIHIEPLQHKKPTALIVVGVPLTGASISQLESAVEGELDNLMRQLVARGEDFRPELADPPW